MASSRGKAFEKQMDQGIMADIVEKENERAQGASSDPLPNRIKSIRQARDMPLTQVSREVMAQHPNEKGLTQSMLQQIESGNRQITLNTAIILADYFDVSLDYLVCRTDDPQKPPAGNRSVDIDRAVLLMYWDARMHTDDDGRPYAQLRADDMAHIINEVSEIVYERIAGGFVSQMAPKK